MPEVIVEDSTDVVIEQSAGKGLTKSNFQSSYFKFYINVLLEKAKVEEEVKAEPETEESKVEMMKFFNCCGIKSKKLACF